MSKNGRTEMPKYQCHKEVWALKIAEIEYDNDTNGSAMLTPEDKRYAAFKVDYKYFLKHGPQVGGYYVRYKDGYESFSPAKEFEDGYTLIGG